MNQPVLTHREQMRAWAWEQAFAQVTQINKGFAATGKPPWVPSEVQMAKMADDYLRYVTDGS